MEDASGKKQLIKFLRSKELFVFGGLWEANVELGLLSCTIVTTAPNARVAAVGQDRTPLIVSEAAMEAWLDPKLQDPKFLRPLLEPYRGEDIEASALA